MMCRGAFVEPPIAAFTTIAFLSARSSRIREGRISSFTSSTMRCPDSRATFNRSAEIAGMVAEPDKAMPMASVRICIVLAVPMTGQAPGPGHEHSSISRRSCSLMRFSGRAPNTASFTSGANTVPSRHFPTSIGPPVTMMEGKFTLIAPMRWPGIMLSHDASRTKPSNKCTMDMISIDAARTSRIASSYFMFSVPMAILPQVANKPNSKGTPPACQMPALTASASCLRCMCAGEASVQELATPINGLPKSSWV